jgi:hypothetical protein
MDRLPQEQMHKRTETAFSEINASFLRKIHAVTFEGFFAEIDSVHLRNNSQQNILTGSLG